ncbi:MAG: ABC transporter ATP-binding protein [Myxococcales bacterium]|nr:ABC transporter ATP-binding protein [Myxococcales bacterium]
MLNVIQLTKHYRHIQAVAGVSFQVAQGEMLGLIGPNGSGKTTTLRIVAGLVQPDSGDVMIGGHSMLSSPLEAKRGLGYVPQELAIYPFLTGQEFLEFVADVRQLPRDTREEQIVHLLKTMELSDAKDRLVREYSEGMARKLSICAALLGPPSVVVLDESLNGLDPQSSRKTRLLLDQCLEKGVAVILTSHILAIVEQAATKVALLHKGTVAMELDKQDLRALAQKSKSLEDVYLELVER